MSDAKQIRALLDCAVKAKLRDAAGIIIPSGVDAAIEAKAYRRCLEIAEGKDNDVNRTTQKA